MTLPPPDPDLMGTEYHPLHPTQAGMTVGVVLGFLLGVLASVSVVLIWTVIQ